VERHLRPYSVHLTDFPSATRLTSADEVTTHGPPPQRGKSAAQPLHCKRKRAVVTRLLLRVVLRTPRVTIARSYAASPICAHSQSTTAISRSSGMVNSKFCGSRSPCKTVEVRPSGKLLKNPLLLFGVIYKNGNSESFNPAAATTQRDT
jgi:hypothetical protein